MTLTKLFQSVNLNISCDVEIKGICEHTEDLRSEFLFLCKEKDYEKACKYKEYALSHGAYVIWLFEEDRCCFHVDDIETLSLSLLQAYYVPHISTITIIGVCGTNGKTSTVRILQQMYQYYHQRCMVIGTGFIDLEDERIETRNTTPSASKLLHYIHKAKTKGITTVLMEISSHAIAQKRIALLQFDCVIYTNLKRDHLDFHKTCTHYHFTKLSLHRYMKPDGYFIVNHDDENLRYLYTMTNKKIITVGQKGAHFQIKNVEMYPDHTMFDLESTRYTSQLLGLHNVYNLSLCMVHFYMQKVNKSSIPNCVTSLVPVTARMEVFKWKDRYIWLDYAHTPSAVENILQFANQVKKHRILTLIGCGGDRDRGKRKEMSVIVMKYSDIGVFTSDNPRTEEPYEILYDMIQNQLQDHIRIFENRECALKYIMKISQPHDIIIVAGKGEENIQLFSTYKIAFSDRDWVLQWIRMEESYG